MGNGNVGIRSQMFSTPKMSEEGGYQSTTKVKTRRMALFLVPFQNRFCWLTGGTNIISGTNYRGDWGNYVRTMSTREMQVLRVELPPNRGQ